MSSIVSLRINSLPYHIIYSGNTSIACVRQGYVEEIGGRIRVDRHLGTEILDTRGVGGPIDLEAGSVQIIVRGKGNLDPVPGFSLPVKLFNSTLGIVLMS